jgi:hypothetical protein
MYLYRWECKYVSGRSGCKFVDIICGNWQKDMGSVIENYLEEITKLSYGDYTHLKTGNIVIRMVREEQCCDNARDRNLGVVLRIDLSGKAF